MKKSFMINLAGISLLFISLFGSCMSSQSFIPVKGSGIAVDRNFEVSGFNSIQVSGGFDVILTQGSNEGVVLTAQENLFEYIHVEVVGGLLKIYTEGNIMPTKALKAQVGFKQIEGLAVSGGGDVVSQSVIQAEKLHVEISGGGDLTTDVNAAGLSCRISGGGDAKINGTATSYEITMSGGGDLESKIGANKLSCQLSGGGDLALNCTGDVSEANIQINGGGDARAEMKVTHLTCSVSGGGNADLSGQVDELEISVNGGGDINASGMTAGIASVQGSGGSDIHINVARELRANISGGGDIYYSGGADVVSIDARGGSEVHKQ